MITQYFNSLFNELKKTLLCKKVKIINKIKLNINFFFLNLKNINLSLKVKILGIIY